MERVIEVINGRRVTVQRSRHSFSISTENRCPEMKKPTPEFGSIQFDAKREQ